MKKILMIWNGMNLPDSNKIHSMWRKKQMPHFKFIALSDVKAIKKLNNDSSVKNSPLIPCYADRYLCFSVKKTFSFDELIRLFFDSEIEDDQIGAISLIAENYPDELYEFILNNAD